MFKQYNKDAQWHFGLDLLNKCITILTAEGRTYLHILSPPFSANDVRVTTRISENVDLKNDWQLVSHEGGHALYEQGLPADDYGLPSGEYLSPEYSRSHQSRLWENHVGKSQYSGIIISNTKKFFLSDLHDVSERTLQGNKPLSNHHSSRTNADELTYHLHVLIRFEIEKDILSEHCQAAQLPEVWNAKYKSYPEH